MLRWLYWQAAVAPLLQLYCLPVCSTDRCCALAEGCAVLASLAAAVGFQKHARCPQNAPPTETLPL